MGGVAWHRGSIQASHPDAPGSNPSSSNIFLIAALFVDSTELEPN